MLNTGLQSNPRQLSKLTFEAGEGNIIPSPFFIMEKIYDILFPENNAYGKKLCPYRQWTNDSIRYR
jgi:hypothetical protein